MKLAALFAPLALAACATVPPGSDGLVQVRFGETARLGALRVTPLALVEDSRCPHAVQCVWAGRVRITARIVGGMHELTLGQPLAIAEGTLLLADVAPVPRAGTPIPPGDYRFGLRFDAGS